MNLFRRKKDAELWPDAELWVLFPDGSFRIDKNPNTEYGIIISYKFKQIYRMKTPMPVYEWGHENEPGGQPSPTGKRTWIMTGDESERPSEEEFQQAYEFANLDATNRAFEASNRRRWAVWWMAIAGWILVALLNFAKILDVLRGW